MLSDIKGDFVIRIMYAHVPVSFFVIDGKGELTLNQQKIQVVKGDIIEVPENESREWNNPLDLPLELLVIKNKSVNI